MFQRVAVIVLNYNNWPDTVECVESLARLEYDHDRIEMIVVDNASTTDASEFEKRRPVFERAFQNFSFIQTGANLGYAGGNNVGIKKALERGAERVLILNNDTIVPPDFLRRMFQCIDFGNQYIGVLGPKILDAAGNIWSIGGRFNWNFFSVTRGILNTRISSLRGAERSEATKQSRSSTGGGYSAGLPRPSTTLGARNDRVVPTDYVSGTAMLVHRSVFEKVGLLPEVYFLYYEDFEFCLKARAAGFFVGVAPEAVVTHKVSKSTQAGSSLYVYYHFRNSLLFTRRNIKPPLRWLIYLFSFWWVLKQCLKLLVPSRRANGWAGLKGMRDFWYGSNL